MSANRQALITTLGFLLAGVGFLALVLSIVGVKLSYLVWLDRPGPLFGFVAKLVMVMTGLIMVYMAQTKVEGEEGNGKWEIGNRK